MNVVCNERDGPRIRVTRILSKTDANLQRVAEKMRAVPNFLDERGWRVMAEPDFVGVEVDNVGIVGMDLLVPGLQGRVHVTFWDHRLRGREFLCKRIALHWLEHFKLARVFTSISPSCPAVLAFCKRVGFEEVSEEGGLIHLVFRPEDYLHRANSTKRGE